MGMNFMRRFRGFMMRVLVEMLIKIRRKIRCGIRAEGDDSSAQFFVDNHMHDFENSKFVIA